MGWNRHGHAPIAGTTLILKVLEHLHLHLISIEENQVTNQDTLNTIVDSISTSAEGIRGDIQALKDQVANGTPAEQLDFSGLQAKADALAALDAENPAVSTEPTDPGTPVDPSL